MPKDSSIKSVLIIGSGPIIIGQACEFDYAGSQAARSLREEGIEVTLINSNPATIMTDPVTADNVYLKQLIVDEGVPNLGHRKHLLGFNDGDTPATHVGIGIAYNPSARYKYYFSIVIAPRVENQ